MKRSPAAAVWLSLFIPGLGHWYLGLVSKGILFALLAAGLIQIVSEEAGGLGLLIPALWLFVMLDAHRSAQEINLRIEAGRPVDPMIRSGSKWWGVALVGLGVVFLLYNFGLFDLDWLWQLWPVALIVLGIRFLWPEPVPRSVTSTLPPPPPVQAEAGPAGEAEPGELTPQGDGDERVETS